MRAAVSIPESVNPSRRDAFVGRVLNSFTGCVEIFSIYLGDRLGYYRAMASGESTTAEELAARTGTAERYTQEWLEQQTVAGIVEVEDASETARERRFRLPPEHAEPLAEPESLNFIAPIAQVLAGAVSPLQRVVEAYRTGGGVPYGDFGSDMREGQARINRGMFLYQLGWEWLAKIGGVDARLHSAPPARVADIGCGCGWSSIGVALAYPEVRVDGFDLDAPSIASARRNAAEYGVSDRVSFEVRDAADPAFAGQYDLAMALECIHDMSNPAGALRAARRMLVDGGSVIVADERVAERFMGEGNDVEPIMYGWSILHCLPAGMADQPSCCTGTVMRPETLRSLAREAGFGNFEVLPIDNFFLRFYRLS